MDLFDYLIEYCVSKGSKDIHYIKKVAFSWHEAGIDTVTRAKQETTTYHRNYFSILKAFGISNRNPIQSEIHMIDHWMKDYGFTMDILTEACSRTVASTGKANFRCPTPDRYSGSGYFAQTAAKRPSGTKAAAGTEGSPSIGFR